MSQDAATPAFAGSYTALITPFSNGRVDEDAFRKLVEFQIESGTHGLVPVGTTGESPTLSHDEHDRVIELCIEQAAGRVPVIAGAGSNATAEAVRLARHAADAGADGVLIVSPYYNKPTQEGLYRHFTSVAEAVDVAVIVYDIPGRSIVRVDDANLVRMNAAFPNISGIKDATSEVGRPPRILNALGNGFSQLSGEDATTLPYLAGGGHGAISVTSNIAPKALADMHNAWKASDVKTAQAINARMIDLHDAMFCEASPGPVKYAAERLGLCSAETRLPLCEIADESKARVDAALRGAGLIN
ncbi:MAG: 4-hydroxy-tetrahydrodipicolinate synthase [Pseudomonadota bacterium]|nr:4-hydroxy-tetrahydrodipicolinate synthase [Pseudomonadota bacterium]MEC7616431.1 4-hydroxy-tetrahydrodipicolinate synthase [Pseudomonadota bacterium]MEC7982277.1 4-hydroxy-tetrahydrodipicolinate synthase [Pseudomonadota bacterium]MEC8089558.1 4-hydroxy-tetrahydrodipicolinate synthase [Pseudomonadota bacterium]MEC8129468.1 4-hydroxy-tetrahydrodipicolinate synthase [Pseudomonadota bacterium]